MTYQDNVVDPVSAVLSSSSASKAHQKPASDSKNSQSDFLYTTNYILEVMQLTNKAMEFQAKQVSAQAQLQNVILEMNNDFSTMNQFFSKLQAQAHAGGGICFYHGEDNSLLSPNSVNGFSNAFYMMSEYENPGQSGWGGQQANFGGDYGNSPYSIGQTPNASYVSTDYQQSMASFMTAFKQLFFSSPQSGDGSTTVGDLSKITVHTKNGPKDVDLMTSGFWSNIGGAYDKTYPNGLPSHVISSTSTDQPSLIQQYIYWSLKCNCDNGTITNLSGINPQNYIPGSTTLDSTLGNMLSVLNDLNASVTVDGNTWTHSTTDNLLSMIMNNKLYNTNDNDKGSTTWGATNVNGEQDPNAGKIDPGLYCAFSYMAYNYFWTKNPNAPDNSDYQTQTNCNVDRNNGVNDGKGTAWSKTGHLQPEADMLSTLYMHTNSTQTTLSSTSSTQNTNFQEATSNVQTMNNAAQQMIQSFSQGQGQTITNFKG
jgi:hypothetical protein